MPSSRVGCQCAVRHTLHRPHTPNAAPFPTSESMSRKPAKRISKKAKPTKQRLQKAFAAVAAAVAAEMHASPHELAGHLMQRVLGRDAKRHAAASALCRLARSVSTASPRPHSGPASGTPPGGGSRFGIRTRLLFKKGTPQRELVDVNEVIRETVLS